MKANESIYNKERQRQILEKIKAEHRVSVKELTEEFNVSGVSIRNDLNILAETGEIIRTHGGAIYVETFRGKSAGSSIPKPENSQLVRLLAHEFEAVNEGDIFFIDGNIPADTLQAAIPPNTSVTIITNRMDTARKMSEVSEVRVVLTGGIVDGERVLVQHEPTHYILQGYNVGKAVFYPIGFTPGVGLTESDPAEIGLKKLIAESALETTAIVTDDRMGIVSLGTYLTTEKLSRLVVESLPSELKREIKSSGVELVCLEQAVMADSDEHATGFPAFDSFRESAAGKIPYQGAPGTGKRIGFANGYSEGAYCQSVEESILEQAVLAGFSRDDIYIRDNRYDTAEALKNADEIINSRPDVFIEFQTDSVTNNIIATKFRDRDIPIMAIDIPIPGAIYMGVDNWESAVLAGKEAVRQVREKWGSWDSVDLAVVFQMVKAGEITMLRSEGFIDELVSEFGEDVEEKIVRQDIGIGTTADAEVAVDQLVKNHPDVRRILATSTTERGMRQVVETMKQRGVWDSLECIVITHGCDSRTVDYIRNGEITLAIGHFPEKYGEYLVPAACALMQGQPVPSHIFVENTVITRDNIDEYYPTNR